MKIVFPGAKIARIDQDTTRSKSSLGRILGSFESGETDILVGTQMISKGLDFENITVVGILSADSLMNYPDFRANERAFQLMAQVSGRAGRRSRQGRVIIQTSDPGNRIIRHVLNNDFEGMFRSQMEERRQFNYPPYCRMIKIMIKHRDRSKLNLFADALGTELRKDFGSRLLGPEYPPISRIQQWYIKNILIKIEREKPYSKAKVIIAGKINLINSMSGASSLRIAVDVDPY